MGFTFQIFFDFSGYSDIAIGVALDLRHRAAEEFDAPYRATSLQDFWRRWHITLSRFLRDFVYIPLGGSRHGLPRHMAALLTTMVLGGLWHGAGWCSCCGARRTEARWHWRCFGGAGCRRYHGSSAGFSRLRS